MSATVSWWDGGAIQSGTVLGWWDGSTVQPVTVLGWWDGSAIQPLTGGGGSLSAPVVLSVSAAITAAGFVARSGDVALGSVVAITATGTVVSGSSQGSLLVGSAVVAASGLVGTSSGASLAASAATSAAGVKGLSAGASIAASASLLAASGGTWAATVGADSPILWWRTGEASGTTAADNSGHSNTGTYVGSPTLGTTGLIAGDTDTAVTLNGTNQRVTGSATVAGYPTSAITCEIALKASALGSQRAIFTKSAVDASFGSGWSFFIVVTSTGQLQGSVFSGSTQRVATSAAGAIAVGTKYVVAVRADTSSVDILINGTQVATTTGLPGAINAGTSLVVVGDWDAAFTHQWFPGVVDEALIFPTKLSDTRLAAHAAAA